MTKEFAQTKEKSRKTAPAGATLHQKILGDIENNIVSGEWPPGYRIPFEVELAKHYNVSRMTANKVLTQLATAGLIERRKKSGSFVAQPRNQAAILEVYDIEDEVRSLNKAYHFRIEECRERRAPESDGLRLSVAGKESAIYVVCLHFAGTQPFCLEERLINLKTVPQAEDMDFSTIPPGKWLISQIPWTAAEHRIFATIADERRSDLLKLPPNSACLVVERKTWDVSGPVTAVRFSYPSDKHAIIARFAPASA